mgnify:CR=1 FL=1
MNKYYVHHIVVKGLVESLKDLEQLGYLRSLLETQDEGGACVFAMKPKGKDWLEFPKGVLDYKELSQAIDTRIDTLVEFIKEHYKFDPSETTICNKRSN